MYNAFMKGVQCFGLSSRVRTDQGRENIEVARYMLCHHGCNHSSVLVGSSVQIRGLSDYREICIVA